MNRFSEKSKHPFQFFTSLKLKELAEKYQVSPAQVALNWTINAHGDAVVAIPGATKLSHAQDNAGAMTFQLTPEEIEKLSGTAAIYGGS